MPDKADGNDQTIDLPLTSASLRVRGDIYPALGDDGPVRIMDTLAGLGLVTSSSDTGVSGIDPVTGASAPLGTDVGFGAAFRRSIQTNVPNGDFSLPPADTNADISADNPLPYWRWVPPTSGATLAYVADASVASGYRLGVTTTAATSGACYIEQLVPVPMSQGQQFQAVVSWAYLLTGGVVTLEAQYLKIDGTTTIGSPVSTYQTSDLEARANLGLVPTDAAYARVRIGLASGFASIGDQRFYDVRVSISPAESSLGLEALTSSAGSGGSGVETLIFTGTVLANSLPLGSVWRYTMHGWCTSTASNTVTFRLRLGSPTLTGPILVSRAVTAQTTASSDGFRVEGTFTVRTKGATGTIQANMTILGTASGTPQPFVAASYVVVPTATVTVDTTVTNLLEFTAEVSAGTTTLTFPEGLFERVRS